MPQHGETLQNHRLYDSTYINCTEQVKIHKVNEWPPKPWKAIAIGHELAFWENENTLKLNSAPSP